jgi:hypothetical protein
MLKHEDLQFGEFEEEVALLGGLVFDVNGSVPEIVTGCKEAGGLINNTSSFRFDIGTHNHPR